MSVDGLFARFAASYREHGSADPHPLLGQLDDPVDRAELEARIDAFLTRNAARPFASETDLETALADPLVQQVLDAAAAPAAEDLVGLRHQVQITREELTRRLAAELGVADRAGKVHDYYHRLERGQLDVGRVKPRVFEALATVLGRPAEFLREAASRAPRAASGGTGPLVFARVAQAPPAAPAASDRPPAAPRDEVDDLFGAQ